MNHFNLKSLAFYGVAIGSVLLLFKTVTAYGENNLKAPPPINGSYRLTLAENLPLCQKPDALMLEIQQSGIYVNASLLPEANADTQKRLPFTGILKNQQLNLSGKVNSSSLCNIPHSQSDPPKLVTIQMQLTDKGNTTGQLTLNSIPQTLGFTAVLQKPPEQPQKPNGH